MPSDAKIAGTLAELRVPTATLRPYGRNPRRGDVAAIARSLEANGQYRPIVARAGTGEVLAGNHTLAAALELGWAEIAATFVEVDDDQAARIVLVDNRTNDLAGYDDAELAELLSSLPGLEGTGWHDDELAKLLSDLGDQAADAGRDTEPGDAPATPTSKTGDVWQLGPHRLACGDATDAGAVDRLLAGATIEMVWTDPPYGVAYEDVRGRRIIGDERDELELYQLLHTSLELAAEHTRRGGAIYLMHSDVAVAPKRAMHDAGWEISQVVVWVKNAPVLSRQDYNWQHEPILYGWRRGAGHRWNGGFTDTTVIDDDVDLGKLSRSELAAMVRRLQNERRSTVVREDRAHVNELHPTVKPVALVAQLVANSSRRGDLVYDPFGGAGTTLIAGDNIGRPTAAMEIDPALCDVTVDRWQRHTGGKATRKRRARASV